jgi:hypothetical protein
VNSWSRPRRADSDASGTGRKAGWYGGHTVVGKWPEVMASNTFPNQALCKKAQKSAGQGLRSGNRRRSGIAVPPSGAGQGQPGPLLERLQGTPGGRQQLRGVANLVIRKAAGNQSCRVRIRLVVWHLGAVLFLSRFWTDTHCLGQPDPHYLTGMDLEPQPHGLAER